VDLDFEVPGLGLDVALFFTPGLAMLLLAILLDFTLGDAAWPPGAFVVDLALVVGFALVTPPFFIGALVVDCPG
jgi:hypothetical protein